MARQRISTTVDPELLAQVRALDPSSTDASLVERAFRAMLRLHRGAQIDVAYERGYTEHPVDEPDAWGDLASFGQAVRQA